MRCSQQFKYDSYLGQSFWNAYLTVLVDWKSTSSYYFFTYVYSQWLIYTMIFHVENSKLFYRAYTLLQYLVVILGNSLWNYALVLHILLSSRVTLYRCSSTVNDCGLQIAVLHYRKCTSYVDDWKFNETKFTELTLLPYNLRTGYIPDLLARDITAIIDSTSWEI